MLYASCLLPAAIRTYLSSPFIAACKSSLVRHFAHRTLRSLCDRLSSRLVIFEISSSRVTMRARVCSRRLVNSTTSSPASPSLSSLSSMLLFARSNSCCSRAISATKGETEGSLMVVCNHDSCVASAREHDPKLSDTYILQWSTRCLGTPQRHGQDLTMHGRRATCVRHFARSAHKRIVWPL